MSHSPDSNKISPKSRGKHRRGPISVRRWWSTSLWHRILAVLVAIVVLVVGTMYGIAQWYITKHRAEPTKLGVTFVPDYAVELGVSPRQTLKAVFDDLGAKRVRLVSYWERGEARQGEYDFSFLDWQFDMAEAAGAKVDLSVGLRQPRWPECHMPYWAETLPKSKWEPLLKAYIQAVVERYRNRPALDSYQLENEYLLKVFGICPDHSRDRLVDEYNLVKKLDPNRPIVVSSSGDIGTPLGKPQPDRSAVAVYKRVWDKTLTKRYFEYPVPAWYYGFRAGLIELTTGRGNTFIHELQAEAWLAPGNQMRSAPIDELYKTLNPQRLRDRFEYGRATGMKQIDLWGVEWWYQMKVHRDAPELWDVAKGEFAKHD